MSTFEYRPKVLELKLKRFHFDVDILDDGRVVKLNGRTDGTKNLLLRIIAPIAIAIVLIVLSFYVEKAWKVILPLVGCALWLIKGIGFQLNIRVHQKNAIELGPGVYRIYNASGGFEITREQITDITVDFEGEWAAVNLIAINGEPYKILDVIKKRSDSKISFKSDVDFIHKSIRYVVLGEQQTSDSQMWAQKR